jgi:hypothetical protein
MYDWASKLLRERDDGGGRLAYGPNEFVPREALLKTLKEIAEERGLEPPGREMDLGGPIRDAGLYMRYVIPSNRRDLRKQSDRESVPRLNSEDYFTERWGKMTGIVVFGVGSTSDPGDENPSHKVKEPVTDVIEASVHVCDVCYEMDKLYYTLDQSNFARHMKSCHDSPAPAARRMRLRKISEDSEVEDEFKVFEICVHTCANRSCASHRAGEVFTVPTLASRHKKRGCDMIVEKNRYEFVEIVKPKRGVQPFVADACEAARCRLSAVSAIPENEEENDENF